MQRSVQYFDQLQERIQKTYKNFVLAINEIKNNDPHKYNKLVQNTSENQEETITQLIINFLKNNQESYINQLQEQINEQQQVIDQFQNQNNSYDQRELTVADILSEESFSKSGKNNLNFDRNSSEKQFIDQSIQNQQPFIMEMQRNFNELQDQNRILRNHIKTIEYDLNKTQTNCNLSEQQINHLQIQNKQLEEQNIQQYDQIQNISNTIDQQNEQVMQETKQQTMTQINRLTNQIQNVQTIYEEKLQKHKDKIIDLNDQMNDSDKQQQYLIDKIEQLNKQLCDLETQYQQIGEENDNLIRNNHLTQQVLKEKDEHIDQKQEEINNLKQMNSSGNNQPLKALKHENQALRQKLDKYQRNKEYLEQLINILKQQLKDLNISKKQLNNKQNSRVEQEYKDLIDKEELVKQLNDTQNQLKQIIENYEEISQQYQTLKNKYMDQKRQNLNNNKLQKNMNKFKYLIKEQLNSFRLQTQTMKQSIDVYRNDSKYFIKNNLNYVQKLLKFSNPNIKMKTLDMDNIICNVNKNCNEQDIVQLINQLQIDYQKIFTIKNQNIQQIRNDIIVYQKEQSNTQIQKQKKHQEQLDYLQKQVQIQKNQLKIQERNVREKSQDILGLNEKLQLYKSQRNLLIQRQRNYSTYGHNKIDNSFVSHTRKNQTIDHLKRSQLKNNLDYTFDQYQSQKQKQQYNLETVSDYSQTKKYNFNQLDQLLDISKDSIY